MSTKLREIMAALVMATLVSTGAVFAQGKGKGKYPDKKPVKVIDGKAGGGGGSRPSNPPPKPPKEDRGKKRP